MPAFPPEAVSDAELRVIHSYLQQLPSPPARLRADIRHGLLPWPKQLLELDGEPGARAIGVPDHVLVFGRWERRVWCPDLNLIPGTHCEKPWTFCCPGDKLALACPVRSVGGEPPHRRLQVLSARAMSRVRQPVAGRW